MGYDVGAGGAFGLLLSEYGECLGTLYEEFLMEIAISEADDEVIEENPDDHRDEVCDKYVSSICQAFYVQGIVVPTQAWLWHTGSEDERPGRTSTPPDDFVLGYGLFTRPHDVPQMDESFYQAADWHTWVWGG